MRGASATFCARVASPIALAVCLASCSSGQTRETSKVTAPAREDPPSRLVRVARVVQVDGPRSFPAHLYVERDVRLTSRRFGIVERVLVDRGAHVSAGQPLAMLDTDITTRELERAQQRLRLAAAENDRGQSLLRQGVLSPQEALRLEIARDVAASEVELAKAQLERCTIRAPFGGVVVERWAVPGQRVREDEDAALFRVAAPGPLRARAYVPEATLRSIHAGSVATVNLTAEGASLPARVVFIASAVDPGSGTGAVIVELPSGAADGKLGVSVDVLFPPGTSQEAALFRVPLQAVLMKPERGGDEASVLVVSSGRAETRTVRVVSSDTRVATVRGDLHKDEMVILAPSPDLAPGERIATQEVSL